LLDVGASRAIYHFTKTAVVEIDLEIRRTGHQPKSPHLSYIFDVKTQIYAPFACMTGQVAPVCFQQLRERLEPPFFQQIPQFRIATRVKIDAVAGFNCLY
jgi:hypothetical protein